MVGSAHPTTVIPNNSWACAGSRVSLGFLSPWDLYGNSIARDFLSHSLSVRLIAPTGVGFHCVQPNLRATIRCEWHVRVLNAVDISA